MSITLRLNIVVISIFALINLMALITADRFFLNIISRSLLWSIVALQWSLLVGYAGVYSYGNLLFFGIGGYIAGILAIWGYGPVIGILVGGLLAMATGFSIGRLTLKLKGIYMAVFTFAMQEAARHIVQLEQFTPWTGGSQGLHQIPKIDIPGIDEVHLHYALTLLLFLLTALLSYLIIRSRYGLLFRAIRDSEDFASMLGVNIYRIRLVVFSVSALFTGVAGGLFALTSGGFTPAMLSFTVMIDVLSMMIVGGMATFYGPIVGSFLMTFITENFRAYLLGELAVLRLALVSLIIPLTLKFFSRGIVGQLEFYLKERERAMRLKLANP